MANNEQTAESAEAQTVENQGGADTPNQEAAESAGSGEGSKSDVQELRDRLNRLEEENAHLRHAMNAGQGGGQPRSNGQPNPASGRQPQQQGYGGQQQNPQNPQRTEQSLGEQVAQEVKQRANYLDQIQEPNTRELLKKYGQDVAQTAAETAYERARQEFEPVRQQYQQQQAQQQVQSLEQWLNQIAQSQGVQQDTRDYYALRSCFEEAGREFQQNYGQIQSQQDMDLIERWTLQKFRGTQNRAGAGSGNAGQPNQAAPSSASRGTSHQNDAGNRDNQEQRQRDKRIENMQKQMQQFGDRRSQDYQHYKD